MLTLTYDEYLGEVAVSLGERALSSLDAKASPWTRAALSAASVSAHWLLSDDSDVVESDGPVLSQFMRVRFAAGDQIDRDAIEWVMGICALLLALAYVPDDERDSVVEEIARALDLGDSLIDAAGDILVDASGFRRSPFDGVAPQIERARALILEGCGVDDLAVLDPFMLLILIGKFRSFFENEVRR